MNQIRQPTVFTRASQTFNIGMDPGKKCPSTKPLSAPHQNGVNISLKLIDSRPLGLPRHQQNSTLTISMAAQSTRPLIASWLVHNANLD